jgi:putative hydrolase
MGRVGRVDEAQAALASALAALMETAFLLERAHADAHRSTAFRRAQAVVAGLSPGEFGDRLRSGTMGELPGIGKATGQVIQASARGEVPEYLADARQLPAPDPGEGAGLLAQLRGDLHSHSEWSDGGSPIADMAETARALGHEYLALTDHSPRLQVANGLTRQRLERQLEVVAELNQRWTDFRLLSGIEVDILDDGALDQDADLLARLDVVVASVHSKLRMPARQMTPRMVAAVANPVVTVLGHCTGRMTTGAGERRRVRPPSEFDAETVFAACRDQGVAVEINSRPERRDPPMALLALALDIGCDFSLDTDAHAPGQLTWQAFGARRAADAGVTVDRIINTRPWQQVTRAGRQ